MALQISFLFHALWERNFAGNYILSNGSDSHKAEIKCQKQKWDLALLRGRTLGILPSLHAPLRDLILPWQRSCQGSPQSIASILQSDVANLRSLAVYIRETLTYYKSSCYHGSKTKISIIDPPVFHQDYKNKWNIYSSFKFDKRKVTNSRNHSSCSPRWLLMLVSMEFKLKDKK